jgi:predicted DNA-binding transcriptional regulator YafY
MRDRLKLPLQYDDHKYGYYYTQPVSSFPTLQITEGELVALFVAEKALQQYRGTTFEKPLVTAFEKLASHMQDTVSFNIGGWDQTISFRTSAEPIVNLEIFDKLAKATSRQRQIEFVYRKPGQDKGDRRVADPYHLSNINGEWFLFAFDHGRKDLRTFVPIRMSELRETGKTFTRPEKFSVQTRLSDSFGVISGKDVHEVVVRFSKASADYIREKRWHPSQVITELPDGRLELRMKISSLAEVQRWILSWGGHASAIAPAELRKMVASAARAIVESTDG